MSNVALGRSERFAQRAFHLLRAASAVLLALAAIACGDDIIDALAAKTCCAWIRVSHAVGLALAQLARELRPSRSRPRIALNLGAVGA
jgi:hypothetical protein